jgi:hypothetical protein
MKFKLLAGQHQHTDGRVYKAGEVLVSDDDLAKIHGKERFERVAPAPRAADLEEPDVQKVPAGSDAPAPPPKPPEEPNPLGTDITTDFPTAEEADLRVFKRNRIYSVARAANPAEAVNEEPLTNREKVVDFIAELTKPKE